MGLGPMHLFVLIIIVLIFFGPSRLPTLGRSMGEAIRGFKKGLEGDESDASKQSLNAARNQTDTQGGNKPS